MFGPVALKKLRKGPALGDRHGIAEARIEEIAATLRDCSFRNGVTLQGFAAKWGLAIHRVHELSAQASRKVRAELTDPDRATARGFSRLEKIADEAMDEADKDGNNASHRKVAIAATEAFFKLSGLAAPTKAAVSVSGDLSGLSDEQLEARAKELVARLAKGSKK